MADVAFAPAGTDAGAFAESPRPLNARLRDILLLAQGVQERLDTEDEDALPELVEGPLPAHSAAPETTGLFPYALQFLETLEVLEPDWRDLLHQGEAAEPAPYPRRFWSALPRIFCSTIF